MNPSVRTQPVPPAAEAEDAEIMRHAAEYLTLLDEIVGESADDAQMLTRLRGTAGGVSAALDLVAMGIPAAFRPEKAEGETGAVLFVIDADGEENRLCFEFLPDRCEPADPSVDCGTVITIRLTDFLRIAFKYIDGNDAYLDGLTEVTGDVYIGTNLDQWFDRPSVDLMDRIVLLAPPAHAEHTPAGRRAP